jgi:hypothetical protein
MGSIIEERETAALGVGFRVRLIDVQPHEDVRARVGRGFIGCDMLETGGLVEMQRRREAGARLQINAARAQLASRLKRGRHERPADAAALRLLAHAHLAHLDDPRVRRGQGDASHRTAVEFGDQDRAARFQERAARIAQLGFVLGLEDEPALDPGGVYVEERSLVAVAERTDEKPARRPGQNFTSGTFSMTARSASLTSKNCRSEKPVLLAMIEAGNCWMAVL